MSLKARIKSVSFIFACGAALFSDGDDDTKLIDQFVLKVFLSGYSNAVIGSVNTLLRRVYGDDVLSHHNFSTVLSSLTFAGAVVGMLSFGYISDKFGRKFGMMSATGIIFIFSGLSAASSSAHGSVDGMLAMLCAMRFLVGIGIGAEYPCGSVSAAEQTEQPIINKRSQHRWLGLATIFMIDFGFVIASFVPLVLFWIFGENHLRAVWRLSLGLGMVPAGLVFLWRLNMDEPEPYKKNSMKRIRIPYWLVIKRYWVQLSAISFTWFLYDFIVYPFGIYSSTIVDNITGGSNSLSVVFGWNVVINLFYIPGSVIGSFAADYLGPKWTMILGLVLQAVIGFFMSGFYEQLTKHIAGFAVIYGIFLSFGEFGPGTNTILLSSKSSSTAIRGQFYGVAAASGKLGAFVGLWAFPPMIKAFGGPDSVRGNTGPFWVGSGLALLSAIITYFFIHPLTQDGMTKEDVEFREYLEAHGYDTSMMGLGEDTVVEQIAEVDEKDEKKTIEEKV